jgi:hypothetical protein
MEAVVLANRSARISSVQVVTSPMIFVRSREAISRSEIMSGWIVKFGRIIERIPSIWMRTVRSSLGSVISIGFFDMRYSQKIEDVEGYKPRGGVPVNLRRRGPVAA